MMQQNNTTMKPTNKIDMYQCKSCGEIFPYPKIQQEESDEQAYSICPKCGSDVIINPLSWDNIEIDYEKIENYVKRLPIPISFEL